MIIEKCWIDEVMSEEDQNRAVIRNLIFVSEMNLDLFQYGEHCIMLGVVMKEGRLVVEENTNVKIVVDNQDRIVSILKGYNFRYDGHKWINVKCDLIVDILTESIMENKIVEIILEANRRIYVRIEEEL